MDLVNRTGSTLTEIVAAIRKVNQIVGEVIAASGRSLQIVNDEAGPSIRTSFALDNRYARAAFGWSPTVAFPDGVRRTIDWWLKKYEQ